MKSEEIRLWKDKENEAFLTTYILDEFTRLNSKKRPAVIICPGGAYLRTSDREAEPVAIKFASLGFNTFVLRYNTFFRSKEDGFNYINKNTNKKIKVNKNTKYPQPLFDLAKAMIIIRENAEAWNIDVDNISICGFSAGAHLAALLGTQWQSTLLKDKFNSESEVFKPKTLILAYPVIDYMIIKELKDKSNNKIDIDMFNVSNEAFFGEENPSDKLRKKLSICNNITDNMIPTFIWHTANDELVCVQNSLNLALALSKKNITYEMHIFENGPHGMSLCNEVTAAEVSQINKDCEKWFELAVEWLSKYR